MMEERERDEDKETPKRASVPPCVLALYQSLLVKLYPRLLPHARLYHLPSNLTS